MSALRSTLAFGVVAALAGCGSSSATPDASTDVAADNPDAGRGCASLARCVGDCGDQACVDVCKARATPEAVALLQAQVACVFGSTRATPPVVGACPNTGGGVCDATRAGYSASACTTCILDAQGTRGACDGQVTACQHSP